MAAIPVAILGASGFAGEGALRILLGHAGFQVVHAGSDRLAGHRVGAAVPALAHETDLVLAPDTAEAIAASGAQAVVLAKKSAEVTKVVPQLLAKGLRLVDIGAEFRLREESAYRKWYGEHHACPELLRESVYGLCEIHRDAIARARVVGNPGCYATTILLPLIPLLRDRVLKAGAPIVASAHSGLSGAGKRFLESNNNLFWAVNENLHSYKALAHQHVGEIDQEASLAGASAVHVSFVPHLVPLTRGIHATISATLGDGVAPEQVVASWEQAYRGRRFVRIRPTLAEVEIANVAGTNFLDCAAACDGRTVIINAALDNLVKGAAGQAVQNLNLMHGLPEEAGLLHRSL
jgi:N-acetyl-gamma-glutamyl-phosphate reductase